MGKHIDDVCWWPRETDDWGLATSQPRMTDAEDDSVAWKSHVGVNISADKRLLKATATGWGRSGALSEALITRHGVVEGFLAVLPAANASLFIGFSTMTGSLYDKGKAHQDDLDFAIRLSADGKLSYQSAAKMQQFYHAQSMEGDAIATVEKGDAIGMRLTADRTGIIIIRRAAADPVAVPSTAAAGGGVAPAPRVRPYTALRTVREVLSFPMKLMVVFGGVAQLGPITWLRGKSVDPSANRKGPADACASAATSAEAKPPSERVVKGRTAADLFKMLAAGGGGGSGSSGGKASGGDCLMLSVPTEGSAAKSLLPKAAKPAEGADAKARARVAALQPKAVARGARLVPKTSASSKAKAPAARSSGSGSSGGSSNQPDAPDSSASNSHTAQGATAAADERDVCDPADKAVPMSATVWALVRLVVASPFSIAEERSALLRLIEHDTITVKQLRALASGLHRLMPRGGIFDEDPRVPPPPPPPPPLQGPSMASLPQLPVASSASPTGVPPFFAPPLACMQPLFAASDVPNSMMDSSAVPHAHPAPGPATSPFATVPGDGAADGDSAVGIGTAAGGIAAASSDVTRGTDDAQVTWDAQLAVPIEAEDAPMPPASKSSATGPAGRALNTVQVLPHPPPAATGDICVPTPASSTSGSHAASGLSLDTSSASALRPHSTDAATGRKEMPADSIGRSSRDEQLDHRREHHHSHRGRRSSRSRSRDRDRDRDRRDQERSRERNRREHHRSHRERRHSRSRSRDDRDRDRDRRGRRHRSRSRSRDPDRRGRSARSPSGAGRPSDE